MAAGILCCPYSCDLMMFLLLVNSLHNINISGTLISLAVMFSYQLQKIEAHMYCNLIYIFRLDVCLLCELWTCYYFSVCFWLVFTVAWLIRHENLFRCKSITCELIYLWMVIVVQDGRAYDGGWVGSQPLGHDAGGSGAHREQLAVWERSWWCSKEGGNLEVGRSSPDFTCSDSALQWVYTLGYDG